LTPLAVSGWRDVNDGGLNDLLHRNGGTVALLSIQRIQKQHEAIVCSIVAASLEYGFCLWHCPTVKLIVQNDFSLLSRGLFSPVLVNVNVVIIVNVITPSVDNG
jgi:hypothetical protein